MTPQDYGIVGSGAGLTTPWIVTAISAAGQSANLVLALDAGDIASYNPASDSQRWKDVAGFGTYHFFRGDTGGSSTDEPTFNGTPGNLSSSEFFSYDGGDFFRQDSATDDFRADVANTFHQNNASFTILATTFLVAAAASTANRIFVDSGAFGGGIGCGFEIGGSATAAQHGRMFFNVINTSGVLTQTSDASQTLVANSWNISAISINEATGAGGGFFWNNGNYRNVSAANTFNATYTSPSASAATNNGAIGAAGDGASKSTNGMRVAQMVMWTRALSKANLDAVYTQLRTRWAL